MRGSREKKGGGRDASSYYSRDSSCKFILIVTGIVIYWHIIRAEETQSPAAPVVLLGTHDGRDKK